MLIDIEKELENSPEVNPRRYTRGDKIDPEGFCGEYKFSSLPKCLCRKYWSLNEVGTICNDCGKKVLANKGMGKFILDAYILNPIIYQMINSTVFFKPYEKDSFNYTTLNEFETKDEMVTYLYDKLQTLKTKNREGLLELVEFHIQNENIDALFTKVIPIVNLRFRKDYKNTISNLNILYGALLQTCETYNNSIIRDESGNVILYGIQKQLDKVNNYLLSLDTLRNDFSPTISMSCRAPVVPQSDDKSYEGISIGFELYKRIFKYRILYYLKTEFNASTKKALIMYDNLHYGSAVHTKILECIKSEALMLINRNPSLHLRSIIAVKLNDVTNTYTIQVPKIVYDNLGMDNDGDTIAVAPLFTKEAREQAELNLSVKAMFKSLYNCEEKNIDGRMLGNMNKLGKYILKQNTSL